MAIRECLMPCHLHSLCGAVYYGFYIYLIQFIKGLFLHDGRYVEKLSSPHPVLARVHASAVSRMENLGRTARWTPATINCVAVLPLVAGELLKWLWPCG